MKCTLVVLAAVASSLAVSASAQVKPPAPGLLLADSNKDGKISLAEYQTHRRNLLMALDTNKDGHIDRAEWDKGAAGVAQTLKADGIDGGGRFAPADWWTRLDANKDGVITPAEIDAMTAKRFKVFDTNINGYIDGYEPQLAKLTVEGGHVP